MNRGVSLLGAALLAVMALVTPAHANVGAPMLAVIWPCAWVLLIPIILVEAMVAARVLKRSFRAGLKVAGIANLVSTLVGIPVTWIVLVAMEMAYLWASNAQGITTLGQKILAVTVQSPWLFPYESEFYWMVPTATVFLCIPFFFMSVWVENRVARKSFGEQDHPNVLRWAWAANGISYGLIVLGLLITVLVAIYEH